MSAQNKTCCEFCGKEMRYEEMVDHVLLKLFVEGLSVTKYTTDNGDSIITINFDKVEYDKLTEETND